MRKVKSPEIYHAKEIMKFKSNSDLKKYYEKMWNKKGYSGYIENGINISKIYDRKRKKAALNFLNPKKEEIILDAGCGNGKISIKVSKKCRKVYGVDISKNAFKKVMKINPKKIEFIQTELEKLPFENNFFDKILCIETLEHVINPEKVLKEFYRVLKSSGTLIITYPTKAIVERIYEFLAPQKKFIISEHLTNYSYSQLKNKLEVTKFKIIQKKGLFFYIPFQAWFRHTAFGTKKMVGLETSIDKFMFNQNGVALIAKKEN